MKGEADSGCQRVHAPAPHALRHLFQTARRQCLKHEQGQERTHKQTYSSAHVMHSAGRPAGDAPSPSCERQRADQIRTNAKAKAALYR